VLNDEQLQSCTQYVFDKVKYIIENCEERPPGGEGERQAQAIIKEELEGCCDGEVAMEPFPVAQKGFMSMPRVAGSLALLALPFYWFVPWVSLALSLLAAAAFVLELGFYKQFLDPFFPKTTSYNVFGSQQPEGEAKRRVILNGHPDGAYEWNFNYRIPKFFMPIATSAVLGILFKTVSDAAFVLLGNGWVDGYSGIWMYVGIVQLILAPTSLAAIMFTNFKKVSPGANDNLSGSLVSVGIAKYLREAGVKLKNTELMVAITGSEEGGLRGAKAFCAKHKDMLAEKDTIVLTLETLCELEHMAVYNKDMNGLVANDPAVCKLLKDSAAACGLDLPYATITTGASDAAAFTQAGVRAGMLCAMDPAPADYYHNRRDNWDIMGPDCIRKGIEVALQAIKTFDENGLPDA